MRLTRKNFLAKAAVIFFLIFSLFAPGQVKAQEKATLHLFWAHGCPHCEKEKAFLSGLVEKYPELEVKDYEVSSNRTNSTLLRKTGAFLEVDASGVPFTVIGQEYFVGYLSDETTGKEIETAVNYALENGCQDVVGRLFSQNEKKDQDKVKGAADTINVPIFGQLDTKSLSLPVLTFVIALLDGFNPCAMWVLLFLISLLLGMEDGIYYGLNPVGAFIWEQIKEPKTIDEVRDAILAEYEVENDECERDLFELLQELAEKGLVEVKE